MPKNLKGTWNQAILSFIFPILLVLTVRWALIEPFIIPSGSMIPTLLVNDHILVSKYSFGLKVPFTNHWLIRWAQPQRGDVLVFRYPPNPDVFYIKRLIGLPGDEIVLNDGRIKINGEPLKLEPTQIADASPNHHYFNETIGSKQHVVRFVTMLSDMENKIVVPGGSYFFMGDNRDESSDSREWGFVDEKLLIGKAVFIWLSCDEMLPTMRFMCNPAQIRKDRIFTSVE